MRAMAAASRKNVADDCAMHVRQPKVATLVFVGQPFVVDPHLMK